jgi:hypothetical protein
MLVYLEGVAAFLEHYNQLVLLINSSSSRKNIVEARVVEEELS